MTSNPALLPVRPRLLLVDDQPVNIQILHQIFHADHEVFMAPNGQEALDFCRATPPDLILLDIVMPGMDGLEVCRRLRADPATAGIPVIFVTAQSNAEDETRAIEAGGADFITKPVNATVVRARVKTHLALKAHRDHLEQLVAVRTAALSVAKEAAESASRAKTLFLANMSHELHTPLNGIMGFTALASRRLPASDPKLGEYLEYIRKSATDLLASIDDILDITKLEAERLTLDQVDFSLGDLIGNMHSLTAPQAAAKGLDLHIDLPSALADLMLQGDSGRLGQILLNLVGNAIKFTAAGTVTVKVSLAETHPEKVLLHFAVKDSGIGIAPADQQRIFQPFVQADGSMTRQHGGSGLGLTISKRLIELMGGEIGVDSQPGQGSTFWFTVSMAKAATPTP